MANGDLDDLFIRSPFPEEEPIEPWPPPHWASPEPEEEELAEPRTRRTPPKKGASAVEEFDRIMQEAHRRSGPVDERGIQKIPHLSYGDEIEEEGEEPDMSRDVTLLPYVTDPNDPPGDPSAGIVPLGKVPPWEPATPVDPEAQIAEALAAHVDPTAPVDPAVPVDPAAPVDPTVPPVAATPAPVATEPPPLADDIVMPKEFENLPPDERAVAEEIYRKGQRDKMVADRLQKAMDQDAEAAQRNQEIRKEAEAHAKQKRIEIEAAEKKLEGATADPNRWWGSKNILQKIGGLLSILAGGFLSPHRGGRNMAVEYIERAMEEDMQAQLADFDRQRGLLGDKRTALQEYMAASEDRFVAAEAWRAATFERMAKRIELDASRFEAGGTAHANAMAAIADLRARKFEALRKAELQAQEQHRKNLETAETIRHHGAQEAIERDKLQLEWSKLGKGDPEAGAKERRYQEEITRKHGIGGVYVRTPDGRILPYRAGGGTEARDETAGILHGRNVMVHAIKKAIKIRKEKGFTPGWWDRLPESHQQALVRAYATTMNMKQTTVDEVKGATVAAGRALGGLKDPTEALESLMENIEVWTANRLRTAQDQTQEKGQFVYDPVEIPEMQSGAAPAPYVTAPLAEDPKAIRRDADATVQKELGLSDAQMKSVLSAHRGSGKFKEAYPDAIPLQTLVPSLGESDKTKNLTMGDFRKMRDRAQSKAKEQYQIRQEEYQRKHAMPRDQYERLKRIEEIEQEISKITAEPSEVSAEDLQTLAAKRKELADLKEQGTLEEYTQERIQELPFVKAPE